MKTTILWDGAIGVSRFRGRIAARGNDENQFRNREQHHKRLPSCHGFNLCLIALCLEYIWADFREHEQNTATKRWLHINSSDRRITIKIPVACCVRRISLSCVCDNPFVEINSRRRKNTSKYMSSRISKRCIAVMTRMVSMKEAQRRSDHFLARESSLETSLKDDEIGCAITMRPSKTPDPASNTRYSPKVVWTRASWDRIAFLQFWTARAMITGYVFVVFCVVLSI